MKNNKEKFEKYHVPDILEEEGEAKVREIVAEVKDVVLNLG